MNNLEKYIYWRGDLTLEQDPFNEVDGAILSELSYVDYLGLGCKFPLNLKEAAECWEKIPINSLLKNHEILREAAYDLLTACGKSCRFQDILLQDFVYELSLEDKSQFGATLFSYKNQPLYLAFQGTDFRVLGWKEDFALSYLPEIPSQKKAKDFLEKHLKQALTPFSIGGHSKGGNLALYAAMSVEESLQEKIETVYNYDGPGFPKQHLHFSGYKNIEKKIQTYIPQDSLVGLLLHRREKPIVIESDAKDLRQHRAYSWKVKGNHFLPSTLTAESLQLSSALDKTLDLLDAKQRQELSHALFSLLGEDSEENIIIGTPSYNLKKFKEALYQLHKLSPESKKLLFDVVREFLRNRNQISIDLNKKSK
ncbi:DUF2974 domain-containing protein [Peptoniphilus sp. KCTC 25270]|uniref:Mbeg1-like protein n=1 Tax=Peptoniphilus sp. KCTC 25270 TaxID=2897414 RepID=UPI001E385BE4|nr:Mbeg1-like protein [Peptoniphilus sp. KCTC 25270]MCD1147951.1 DUF2974 domain-containing protein [Peptoniphilus sp. KCTC 25270]